MQYGPKIVTNGLVLALDAAEANSYGPIKAEVLVVAGGGGGGSDMGGGGGGGGVLYSSSYTVTRGSTITVTVGNGGAGATAGVGQARGTNGDNSVFGSLTSIGGGGGASCHDRSTSPAGNGGSGGGASGGGTLPSGGSGGGGYGGGIRGLGTSGQGYDGGTGIYAWYPGGGGGAGGPGTNNPATGGPGVLYSSISSYYFGGGGGGSGYSGNGGNGGIGGGGGGAVGTTTGGAGLNNGSPGGGGSINSQTNTPGGNAGANTGGGGGGGSHYSTNNYGGNGGSGIVIVRYKGPQKATGGTITTVDNETVHTFTSSGSFVAGTNFADLSGNNITCTLTGSPVFNSANNGSIVFNGSTQFSTFTPTPTILQGNPNFTVIGFYKRTGNFSSKGFWGIGGSNAGGTGQGICNWNYGNTNEIAIDSWGESTFTTGQTYPLNTWIGVAWRKIAGPTTRANCIISIFDGTNITHYTSTALTVLRAESATNLNINSIGGITLGSISVDTGYCSPVNIANHCIYNRLLSDAEILLNFQATKARFGL